MCLLFACLPIRVYAPREQGFRPVLSTAVSLCSIVSQSARRAVYPGLRVVCCLCGLEMRLTFRRTPHQHFITVMPSGPEWSAFPGSYQEVAVCSLSRNRLCWGFPDAAAAWCLWPRTAPTAAAAAAKSLQWCPTLCDPIDGSPPGSAVPGSLQASTLGWVAIFLLQCVKVKSESEVAQSCPTPQRPHELQPSRLLRPWDFPGKSTGERILCRSRPERPVIKPDEKPFSIYPAEVRTNS